MSDESEASWLSRMLMPGPLRALGDEIDERLAQSPIPLNEYGYDPYGFHAPSARRLLLPSALLYKYWFRVETRGTENVPEGRPEETRIDLAPPLVCQLAPTATSRSCSRTPLPSKHHRSAILPSAMR